MKLSSREQLLKEADRELNSIRIKNLLESDGKIDTEKIEKVAKSIIYNKNEIHRQQLESELEKLRQLSQSMQKDYEDAKKKGMSLRQFYSSQGDWKKRIYQWERSTGKKYKGDLWEKVVLSLGLILHALGSPVVDKEGNIYDLKTGEKLDISGESLSSHSTDVIRTIIRSLTI